MPKDQFRTLEKEPMVEAPENLLGAEALYRPSMTGSFLSWVGMYKGVEDLAW